MKEKTEPKNWGLKFAKYSIFFVAAIIVLCFLGTMGYKIFLSWREIMFAVEKPKIVQAVREDYETRQKNLEKALSTRQKSAQDKLLESISNLIDNESK